MARVTIEDCLKYVDNRFDLVIKAAKRAHMLELGEADPQVPLNKGKPDKPTVLALREIAAGKDITKTRINAIDEELLEEASHFEMSPAQPSEFPAIPESSDTE